MIEQVKGLAARIEFFDTIERNYNEGRSADAERPLVKIDGSKDGDSTVMYDKGGWVFWMLLNHVGRDKMLEGLQQFMRQYRAGTDHPVLQDFVAAMRPFAQDPQAYDKFVKQWFFEVVVPQYKFDNVQRKKLNDQQWEVTAQLTNIGTGRMPVEVAATTGDRFDDKAQLRPEYRDQRTHVTLGQRRAGRSDDRVRLRAATTGGGSRPTGPATQTQTVTIQLLTNRALIITRSVSEGVRTVTRSVSEGRLATSGPRASVIPPASLTPLLARLMP